jgi:hypothetical protein
MRMITFDVIKDLTFTYKDEGEIEYPKKYIFRPDTSLADVIATLERYVLIYSYLYYEKGLSPISDYEYDHLAKYLYMLCKTYPHAAVLSQYYYVFKDYTPDTGFNLFSQLNDYNKERIAWHADLLTKKNRGDITKTDNEIKIRVELMRIYAKVLESGNEELIAKSKKILEGVKA